MDITWSIIALLALAGWIALLARVVRDDGLGDREPPRSTHPEDSPRWLRLL